MVQLSLRRLMLLIGVVALCFALIRLGYGLFGTIGGIIFGAFFGIAILCAYGNIANRRVWTLKEHVYSISAMLVSAGAGLYVANEYRDQGYTEVAKVQREAATFQSELRHDTRYRRVSIRYTMPSRRSGGWTINGTVKTNDDANALRGIVTNRIGEFFAWNVQTIK